MNGFDKTLLVARQRGAYYSALVVAQTTVYYVEQTSVCLRGKERHRLKSMRGTDFSLFWESDRDTD